MQNKDASIVLLKLSNQIKNGCYNITIGVRAFEFIVNSYNDLKKENQKLRAANHDLIMKKENKNEQNEVN